MKNEISYKIPQDKIREFFDLDSQKFQELKKQVGINTIEPLNLNNLKALISFSSYLGLDAPAIDIFDLKPFEVDESTLKVEKTIIDIPEPKKIKIYKEKKPKPIKQKIEKVAKPKPKPIKQKIEKVAKPKFTNLLKDTYIFKTHDEASLSYRADFKNIWWTTDVDKFEFRNENKFDDSGSYSFNFSKIKALHPTGRIYFFTNNTYYERKSVNSRKRRVFTEKEDKKILEYYNSEFYKNNKIELGKKPYTMKDLCIDLNVKDRKVIVQRASELGFTNFVTTKVGNEYTEEELEILKANVGKITTKKIQQLLKEKGYQKSIVSINVKLTRLNLSLKLDGTNDLTLTLLAKALGVDLHNITDNKKLMADVNPEKTKKELIFKRENLKKYIIENPYDLNFGKIDNKFLVELLVGEK
uniref:hypothetical protein n=1 Tax=Aliarcobacter sp. TaxID=2321116 RepID=UPI004047323E